VDQRPGFAEMLQQLATDSAKTIIVESPDRFARDLAVQLAGHDMLKGLGISIIPASAPDFFTEDTPTAVLVRQVARLQLTLAPLARTWDSSLWTRAFRLPRLCVLGQVPVPRRRPWVFLQGCRSGLF